MLEQNKPIKVLLISEDPDDVRLTQQTLAGARDAVFELECADRLSTGLERLAGGGIGLVLLDISLPDSSGLQGLARAHAQAPRVPIIVFGASEEEGLAMEAVQQGAQEYLVKGKWDSTLLGCIIRYVMEKRLAVTALEENTRQLEASTASFRNLIESNADGIAVVDQNRVVRFVNPALERLLGRQGEELLCEVFGLPIVAGEATEVAIPGEGIKPRVAEMRVVETVWEGETVYLASLRDITDRKRTEEDLRESLAKWQAVLDGTVQAIALTLEKRDPYTAGHERRVTKLACAIASEMGLDQAQVEGIRIGGLLHDIGKIGIPSEILSKPGPLSQLELDLLKAHPQAGFDILKTVEFPWPVAQMVLQHHERLDGSGYPLGLPGGSTLLESRILAVSDVVEAMASHRPYRPALGIDEALAEISGNRGILYDPTAVERCLRLFQQGGFAFD